jgi:hypothetical protein
MQTVMGFRAIWTTLLLSALLTGIPARFGGVASAGTIDLWSSPGVGSNNITGINSSVAVAPSWAVPTNSNYEWISYGATGCNVGAGNLCPSGPNNPAATTITGTPTATFYQTFTLTTASAGGLDVWADDTAGVWLDSGTVASGDGSSGGTLLAAPNGDLGSHCASSPIGCTPGSDAVIPLSLSAGTYTLVLDAYQLVGGTPFGVMYDGQLTSTGGAAPEPASYMLMGLGLAGLSVCMRRRKLSNSILKQ